MKKIKTIKKYAAGGATSCTGNPKGNCGTYPNCHKCFSQAIAKAVTTGFGALFGSSEGMKKRKKELEKKKLLAEQQKAANTPQAKFKSNLESKLKTQKKGGTVKSKTKKK